MKEQQLQKIILDYLRLKRYVAIKFNSSGIYNKKTGKYIPQPQRGISDILACSPKGEFLAIEVKVNHNKSSEEQILFIESIRKNSGKAIIAYSLDDIIAYVP